MANSIQIVQWDKKYRNDFIRLNREWIERYFRLEPCDLKILGNPEKEIIGKGGELFFALDNGQVIGCCALIHHPESGKYELAKMAVTPQSQGKGAGFKLGSALIRYAEEQRIPKLFLEANTLLEASVKLYYKLGFKAVEADHPAYDRCNLYMELKLSHND
ncbi:GNAT family N-acetyltransferase [uncultured Bacteroides sp.]|uniref:GNAT family N-acetyltransferase n=1 Tax=uncultured Bacteroides sp. TaxID=162156 RepID=UPI002637CC8E|nr:GNAT family N-acetyltransferase [uncultured Bacteroides sp.]